MKKRVAAIRAAKTWEECLTLAKNEKPNTKFDCLFDTAKMTRQFLAQAVKLITANGAPDSLAYDLICRTADRADLLHMIGLTTPPLDEKAGGTLLLVRQQLVCLGLEFATLLRRDDGPHILNELSAALSAWRSHKPNLTLTDHIRAKLFARHVAFPPGKPRFKRVRGKLTKVKPWPKETIPEIVDCLQRDGLVKAKMEKSERDDLGKLIKREAVKWKVPLDCKPGRPAKRETGQEGV